MVSVNVLLLLFFILGCKESQGCALYRQPVELGCYSSYKKLNSSEESGNGCYKKINVTYDVVDADEGVVITKFTLPPFHCGHTHYVIELYANDKINKSLCLENTFNLPKHSVREYNIWKCQNGSCESDVCEQYGKVVFNYVYSSCYKLRVRPYIRSSSQASLSSYPYYVETNYTQLKIANLTPNVGPTYRSKEKSYKIDVSYPQVISKSTIELNFCENDSRVNGAMVSVNSGIVLSCHCAFRNQYDVKIDTNSTFERMVITFVGDLKELVEETCEKDGVDQSCCSLDSSSSICTPIVMDAKCDYMFKYVDCTFYNVTPGNYCIRIVIDDDRCLPDTIWTTDNHCRWSTTLVIEQQVPDKPSVNLFSVSSIGIGVIIIVIGLSLLVTLVFWVFKRRKSQWSSTPGESPDELIRPMVLKMKVLLLYPRDCEYFMNVMDSFGKVLEKFHNVEVFDCYNNEEVLNGPLAWLQSLMTHPRLCTIVVTSQCAHIQQKAMKSGHATAGFNLYKEPTFLDSLFIYGLKLIMEDVSPDIYRKSYVIGFNGFSENAHTLSLPTSFRRYIIPNHLKKLLSDMNVENCDENFHLLNSSEYITLQNNLRSLVEYRSKNPQYLENILNLM